MSNAVEDFLHALKRTINGDPYPDPSGKQHAAVSYRIASLRDLREGVLLSGKYLIQKRIGKGAMATVYKAVQQPIDRVVAIKILNTAYSQDPVNIKRFNREAKTLSNLKHRNILSIHDLGTTEDGQPFLVMEFLDGYTLESLIAKRGPIPIARAVPLFCQLCEGLSYAHKRGLIHRDLKPGNVMLVKDEDDGSELAKLVDFGIVKVDPNSQNVSQKLTQKGEIWGSPVYMSPEQCMGSELDSRSDIYSFGLLMYEALIGVSAFQGEAIGKIISKQLGEMPRFFKDVDPVLKIPEKLEEIVFRAIRKKPDDRFQSMDELLKELDAFARQFRIRLKGTASTKLNSDYYRTIAESAQAERFSPPVKQEPVAAAAVPPEKTLTQQLRTNAVADAAGFARSEGISPGKIKMLITVSCIIALAGLGAILFFCCSFFGSIGKQNVSVSAPAIPGSSGLGINKPAVMNLTNGSSGNSPSGSAGHSDGSIVGHARRDPSADPVSNVDLKPSNHDLSSPSANDSRSPSSNDSKSPSNNDLKLMPNNNATLTVTGDRHAALPGETLVGHVKPDPTDGAAPQIKKQKPGSKSRQSSGRKQVRSSNFSSELSDQDLERIHLKRKHYDDSQQIWSDAKSGMQSP